MASENADAAKSEHEMGEVGADEVVGTKMSRRIASANDLHASQDSIAVRLWRVVRDPAVALRFFLFLMSGASMTITDLYLFLWLEDLGGTPADDGRGALFCTCVCEVAVFYNGARIKKALTLDWCLALVPFCYFIRQFYYWLLPAFGNPWAVLPVQFLHGVTFGLYWSTANDFIQDISPYRVERVHDWAFQRRQLRRRLQRRRARRHGVRRLRRRRSVPRRRFNKPVPGRVFHRPQAQERSRERRRVRITREQSTEDANAL